MWRYLRTGLLFYLLVIVAIGAWLSSERSTDWQETLWITIFPINGDDSATSAAYIENLTDSEFIDLVDFFQREAGYYDVALERPFRFELGPQIQDSIPSSTTIDNPVRAILWSLRLRLWATLLDKGDTAPADILVFVRYHAPETNTRLAHSLGLQKGLIGVVNAYASANYAGRNNVVVAHEILHTLGASDKYDAGGEPIYPQGYAEPDLQPLHPQTHAELMGGRIALSQFESKMPNSLRWVVIGEMTAEETDWTR